MNTNYKLSKQIGNQIYTAEISVTANTYFMTIDVSGKLIHKETRNLTALPETLLSLYEAGYQQ